MNLGPGRDVGEFNAHSPPLPCLGHRSKAVFLQDSNTSQTAVASRKPCLAPLTNLMPGGSRHRCHDKKFGADLKSVQRPCTYRAELPP